MIQPLTTAQLAATLNVSEWTVSNWARRGVIPCSQIGRHRYFVLDDVLAATKQQTKPQSRLVMVRGNDFEAAREFARGGKRKAHR